MRPSTFRSLRTGVFECVAVVTGFAAVTVLLTYPLAFNLSTLGYKLADAGDPQYSVWNVAWVAHALVTDPLNVFNANIFFPHERTLIYSEANIAAGVLGIPAYLLTRDAYATHNFVFLLSFVLSGTGTYYLVRYIVKDRRAAAFSGICFAFCPYAFGHMPHIQLLMTAGIPFSLLAFHRLADRPSAGRGAALGTAMGFQGLACAYYAVFVVLLIGLAVVFTGVTRGLWKDRRYWASLAAGAAVAIAIVLPLFLPYVLLQRDTGFARALDDSRRWSANLLSYITSARYTSSWLRGGRNEWTDVLFPGLLATVLGFAGFWVGYRSGGRARQFAALYGIIAVFAFWQSFGPKGGLYTLTYYTVPAFTFLRAPSRFGVVVTLALSVLTGMAIAQLLERSRLAALTTIALLVLAVSSSIVPIPWSPNPPLLHVYRVLATLPDGAVIEFPLFSRAHNIKRTRYMLGSTVHWKPLVNAYSDMSPASFSASRDVLGTFPSIEAFERMPEGVRYAIFHLEEYRNNGLLEHLETSLAEFGPYVKPLYADADVWLYEIIGFPPTDARSPRSPSMKTAAR